MKHKFVDAREMAKNNPKTFDCPDDKEIEALLPKDFIKVCHNDERFWLEIIENDKTLKIITGIITNKLCNKQPFMRNDVIDVQYCNVYNVMLKDEANRLRKAVALMRNEFENGK